MRFFPSHFRSVFHHSNRKANCWCSLVRGLSGLSQVLWVGTSLQGLTGFPILTDTWHHKLSVWSSGSIPKNPQPQMSTSTVQWRLTAQLFSIPVSSFIPHFLYLHTPLSPPTSVSTVTIVSSTLGSGMVPKRMPPPQHSFADLSQSCVERWIPGLDSDLLVGLTSPSGCV